MIRSRSLPWSLIWLLLGFGCLGGVISVSGGKSFLSGFLVFSLPPLVLGVGFAAYALGVSYLIKRFGGDPSNGSVGVALFLSFTLVVLPSVVLIAEYFGVQVSW